MFITSAKRGVKIVVLDKEEYLKECTKQLENQEFYRTVDADPTTQLAEEIKNEMKAMQEKNMIGAWIYEGTRQDKMVTQRSEFFCVEESTQTSNTFPNVQY